MKLGPLERLLAKLALQLTISEVEELRFQCHRLNEIQKDQATSAIKLFDFLRQVSGDTESFLSALEDLFSATEHFGKNQTEVQNFKRNSAPLESPREEPPPPALRVTADHRLRFRKTLLAISGKMQRNKLEIMVTLSPIPRGVKGGLTEGFKLFEELRQAGFITENDVELLEDFFDVLQMRDAMDLLRKYKAQMEPRPSDTPHNEKQERHHFVSPSQSPSSLQPGARQPGDPFAALNPHSIPSFTGTTLVAPPDSTSPVSRTFPRSPRKLSGDSSEAPPPKRLHQMGSIGTPNTYTVCPSPLNTPPSCGILNSGGHTPSFSPYGGSIFCPSQRPPNGHTLSSPQGPATGHTLSSPQGPPTGHTLSPQGPPSGHTLSPQGPPSSHTLSSPQGPPSGHTLSPQGPRIGHTPSPQGPRIGHTLSSGPSTMATSGGGAIDEGYETPLPETGPSHPFQQTIGTSDAKNRPHLLYSLQGCDDRSLPLATGSTSGTAVCEEQPNLNMVAGNIVARIGGGGVLTSEEFRHSSSTTFIPSREATRLHRSLSSNNAVINSSELSAACSGHAGAKSHFSHSNSCPGNTSTEVLAQMSSTDEGMTTISTPAETIYHTNSSPQVDQESRPEEMYCPESAAEEWTGDQDDEVGMSDPQVMEEGQVISEQRPLRSITALLSSSLKAFVNVLSSSD